MTYKNSCKFVGHWKDDKPHGIGTMTHPDGTKLAGEFKDGEFVGEQ